MKIPTDATRIVLHSRTDPGWVYLSAADFTAYAHEVQPEDSDTVEAVAGPTLLHHASHLGNPNREATLTVWSDGLLSGLNCSAPYDLRMNHDWDESGLRPRRLAAVEPLLADLLRAGNFADLPPGDWWMNWVDATALDSAEPEQIDRVDRALETDMSAWRILAIVRHRITLADGTEQGVFEVSSKTWAKSSSPFHALMRAGAGLPVASRHVFHLTHEEAARTAETWRAEQSGHPALVSRVEAAALCGTTPAAFAQALSRADREWRAPGPVPRPRNAFTVTRKEWLDPYQCVQWWESRPGPSAGPGRGHRTSD
ncbi:hypothetical protein ABT095_14325 [Kitasatospora sp. NPDC002227]|uniref:hypothetical protein n=1 Tax=Kitasatospora sp. NPDC002227 TaxID=3154773 RepID=UPI00331A21A3